MDQQIIDALKAVADKLDQWQFPVAVIEFQDGDCETIAVPAAHLTDISWGERGREYATLVTLTRGEVEEWLAQ